MKSIRAFTLPEILVATALSSFIIALITQLFMAAAQAWSQSETRQQLHSEDQSAIHWLSRDLHNAFVTHRTPLFIAWPELSDANDSLLLTVPCDAKAQEGNRSGDLCLIGYYVKFAQTPFDPNGSYDLHRWFRRSDQAADLIRDAQFFSMPQKLVSWLPERDEVVARHFNHFHMRYQSTPESSWEQGAVRFDSHPPTLIEFSFEMIDDPAALHHMSSQNWPSALAHFHTNYVHPVGLQ